MGGGQSNKKKEEEKRKKEEQEQKIDLTIIKCKQSRDNMNNYIKKWKKQQKKKLTAKKN